ncbi:MAG: tRNA pseudouridine(55) synthase TruB [Ignavibacteria bacterium]|nr:tRNA pseudouridine(55) synthase TruB [Ignavibacteria bacterium]MBK6419639.1 tRNA pseudouridine(55) synthase TruB [Ignavibacteria bacterium]MBK6759731.1 tRNA pseudouridine(55) synthase TruB [Ignavibacteria bacterium]MBP7093528.1 tRNA pseudouridine(55) synthase TruB [Candidatus Kapabacteria bacterium]
MTNDRPLLDRTSLGDLDVWLESARTDGAIALIDKETDWTSFDCVAKLRGLTRVKRVGHAGTLDPLATGLLVICFGKATKDIATLQDDDKVYDVQVTLGATSTTDDSAGEITDVQNVHQLTDAEILAALLGFKGTIDQTPPAYSAVKHQGRRQYDLAREGKEFTPKSRQVTIHSISNVVINWPVVSCTIHCTKGTYIRSIARDLGDRLGCGGYVTALRRTRSGGFSVEHALRIDDVRAAIQEKAVV